MMWSAHLPRASSRRFDSHYRHWRRSPRTSILQSLSCCREPWRAALERIFDQRDLSRARRVEAIRHLNSTSHWTLLHLTIEQHYGVSKLVSNGPGIMADQMAATLLNLTGQNFQTTRDHIVFPVIVRGMGGAGAQQREIQRPPQCRERQNRDPPAMIRRRCDRFALSGRCEHGAGTVPDEIESVNHV